MKASGSTRRSRNTTTENSAGSWTRTATASSCGNLCRKSSCPGHLHACCRAFSRLYRRDDRLPTPMPDEVNSPCTLEHRMDKRIASADAAIEKIRDGATILMGGFGLCGIPENLIAAIRRKGVKDLTIVSNNAGVDDFGIGVLLQQRQVKKMISTYVGENKLFEQLVLRGELQVELNPQGTLSERLRAGGAGIPAFYTPTGYGTMVADNKETRDFDGRPYVLERALRRNFNPMMATAADYVIAEVEELVELGQLDPNQVHTPGIFIDAIFQGQNYAKRIERRTIRKS